MNRNHKLLVLCSAAIFIFHLQVVLFFFLQIGADKTCLCIYWYCILIILLLALTQQQMKEVCGATAEHWFIMAVKTNGWDHVLKHCGGLRSY